MFRATSYKRWISKHFPLDRSPAYVYQGKFQKCWDCSLDGIGGYWNEISTTHLVEIKCFYSLSNNLNANLYMTDWTRRAQWKGAGESRRRGLECRTAALPHKCMQVHMRSRINHHTNRVPRSAGQRAIS
jgi:hypothetical protein